MVKFTYQNPEKSFSCQLQCNQCTAHTENGSRCKLRVCVGVPYCWIHNRSIKHLAMKNSTIQNSGKGLFAIRTKTKGLTQQQKNKPIFKKDEVITKYDGEKLSPQQLNERYGESQNYTAPYALSYRKNKEDIIIDAACKRGIGSIANHKAKARTNAKLTEKGNITAIKPIFDGQEIFVNYGSSYQLHIPGTTHKTK